MKYVVMVGDGMADEWQDGSDEKTPLMAARTPVLDFLAERSELGLARTVPTGMEPGSDVANMSILGYEPALFHRGRASLEALSSGIFLREGDAALRCNLVSLSEEQVVYGNRRMMDFSAGGISTEEADACLGALLTYWKQDTCLGDLLAGWEPDACPGNFPVGWKSGACPGDFPAGWKPEAGIEFYGESGYRQLLILRREVLKRAGISASREGELPFPDLTPPHNIRLSVIEPYLPGNSLLRFLMEDSCRILKEHPVNRKRRRQGLLAANSLWFWGAGIRTMLPSFYERTGLKGVMISASELLRGLGMAAGLTVPEIPGATGRLDTNYEGKAEAVCRALLDEGMDFAFLHYDAPDERGHVGDRKGKIRAIEALDSRLIKPVYETLLASGEEFRLLILSDHPTPVLKRSHTAEPVPYLIYDSRRQRAGTAMGNTGEDGGRKSRPEFPHILRRSLRYTEADGWLAAEKVRDGSCLMNRLLEREEP